jgi:hypothetical protein
MGLFDFFGGENKSSSGSTSSAPASSESSQKAAAQPQRTVEVTQEPAAKQQAAQPAPPPEQKVVVKGWKFVFAPNIPDASKVEYWFTKLIHVVNYEWHYDEPHAPRFQGRVGWRSDKKKIQLEIKGSQKDIDKLLAWCKMDHLGVKVKDGYVEKYSHDSMSHSGLFARKDGMS